MVSKTCLEVLTSHPNIIPGVYSCPGRLVVLQFVYIIVSPKVTLICKVTTATVKIFSLVLFCLSLFLGVPSKPHLSGFENPVMEGGSVTLSCTSTGSKPPAKLHWYREDQELPGELWREFYFCPPLKALKDSI